MEQDNKAIADKLRQLADRIERDPERKHMKRVMTGGELKRVNVRLEAASQLPGGFHPVGLSIFIGDKEFVDSSVRLFLQRR